MLAVLLLSLGLTTAVFMIQAQSDQHSAAQRILANGELAGRVRGQVYDSLLNSSTKPPLAHVNPLALGIDRVLLTTWPNNDIVDDTFSGRPALHTEFPTARSQDVIPLDGNYYVYRAIPLIVVGQDSTILNANATSYRDIVMLVKVKSLPELAWNVIRQLTLAGAVAVIVSLLAALVVVRAITRPLHGMTMASERMAAGDYDQQVTGADSAGEVGQLARSFNRMAYEVKRVREAQRRFIANVSHDLRSPLTSIIGFSQALTEDDSITSEQRHLAEIIHTDAQRLYRLTMDLLDLSRLEAGRLPLSRQPLDLNATLREIAARYHVLPTGRGIRFVESLCDGLVPVLGDPDRLTQVVVNLLDNALKFCDPGGEVRLSSACRDGAAVLEVYNSGAGIAPEDLPRVFDRFYRADHSRSQQTGGSGIGLAIVRELVYAHGGEVTASSASGAGVTMTVRLPLAPDITFTKDLHLANTSATGLRV